MTEPPSAESLLRLIELVRGQPHNSTEWRLIAIIDALTAERDRYLRLLGLLVLPLGETEREA